MSNNIKTGSKVRKVSDKQGKKTEIQKIQKQAEEWAAKQGIKIKQNAWVITDNKNSVEIKLGDMSITVSSSAPASPKGCLCDLCENKKEKHICLCNACERHKRIAGIDVEVDYDCYNACGLLPKHLVEHKKKPKADPAPKKVRNKMVQKYDEKNPPTKWHRFPAGFSYSVVQDYFIGRIKAGEACPCAVCKQDITDVKELMTETAMEKRGNNVNYAQAVAIHHKCRIKGK